MKLDFQVLVPPSQLRGVEVVWKVFQDCDKKNKELTSIICDLLTKLYHNLSEQIPRDLVEKIQDEFCGAWLEQLQRVSSSPSLTEEEKKLFVQSSSSLLKSFLSDCERFGLGSMRVHGALDRGEMLEHIVIQNQISTAKNMPKFIELKVY